MRSEFETHPTWVPSLDAIVLAGALPHPVNQLIRFKRLRHPKVDWNPSNQLAVAGVGAKVAGEADRFRQHRNGTGSHRLLN